MNKMIIIDWRSQSDFSISRVRAMPQNALARDPKRDFGLVYIAKEVIPA